METGASVIRAMLRTIETRLPGYSGARIDLINMSYGESAQFCQAGRASELIDEVVNKYGVIWLGSASNAGPALQTIGVPPTLPHDSIIGVGAYVFPEMQVNPFVSLPCWPLSLKGITAVVK